MTGFLKQSLKQLISNVPCKWQLSGDWNPIPITGLVMDSRLVQPGNLFFAVVGENTDGHRFIQQALEKGAAGIVGEQPAVDLPVPYIQTSSARELMAHLAAAFYGNPARNLTVIGVTGTDGKTTTSNLIFQILIKAGLSPGIISTVNAVIGNEEVDTGLHVTTPEAPDVQYYLSRMVASGMTHVVLESTSHGLAQHRVTACEFDIAVVTNITHEHLDFHGSYESYRQAKGRLFQMLADTVENSQGNPRLAVLNKDDISYEYLKSISGENQRSYSLQSGADTWAEDVSYSPGGLKFTICTMESRQPVHCNLLGAYNISNCLAAYAAAVYGLKIPPAVVAEGIAALKSIPGRMERINLGQDFIALVDFAHTPNALKNALETTRKMTSGRVIAVFGSAGLRDRDKRRLMSEVSQQYADVSILTAEDPRTESLQAILADMAEAAALRGGKEGQSFFCAPDRREAIRQAVQIAKPGDVVICCGKGHEQSMCFGTEEYPWDDRTALRAALSEKLGVEGPSMPILPGVE
ncbi:MAG: UDP-N-acetylmuramoyl-L-alanyl-D-glutamate--2,6-diaminopimelate ligase [Leptolinea sp.]